ncbi:MAG: thiamine phosphate synthase, partial [Verrucomicrobiaceae bacterium]
MIDLKGTGVAAVTPFDADGNIDFIGLKNLIEHLIAGGVDLLQLRAKGTDEVTIEEIARELVEVSEPAGIPLMINDFPQIVPSLGAQGAHVGQDDFAVEDARWRAGRSLDVELPPVLIGKSTHSVEQAVAAQAAGADYIGFGPLFATPTKPGRPAIGLSEIRRVHELVTIPIFCIGGIKLENLQEVIDAGARRVVIVSGILTADDIPAYCRAAKALLHAAR